VGIAEGDDGANVGKDVGTSLGKIGGLDVGKGMRDELGGVGCGVGVGNGTGLTENGGLLGLL